MKNKFYAEQFDCYQHGLRRSAPAAGVKKFLIAGMLALSVQAFHRTHH